jgi:DNA-binding NtrC family response regulator
MSQKINKTVLIVDDEIHITTTISALLEDDVTEILVAGNGVEAMDIILANNVDLILTDVKMPKMNGFELAKKVRELSKSIPIIFYTSFGSDKLKIDALKYGAFDFVEKPEMSGLVDSVKRALNPNAQNISEDDLLAIYQKMIKSP